jgi:hypothetical protein
MNQEMGSFSWFLSVLCFTMELNIISLLVRGFTNTVLDTWGAPVIVCTRSNHLPLPHTRCNQATLHHPTDVVLSVYCPTPPSKCPLYFYVMDFSSCHLLPNSGAMSYLLLYYITWVFMCPPQYQRTQFCHVPCKTLRVAGSSRPSATFPLSHFIRYRAINFLGFNFPPNCQFIFFCLLCSRYIFVLVV